MSLFEFPLICKITFNQGRHIVFIQRDNEAKGSILLCIVASSLVLIFLKRDILVIIDKASSLKMAGYWPSFFLRVSEPRLRLGP